MPTLVYTVVCRNKSQAQVITKWQTVPTDANMESLLQLLVGGDTTVASGSHLVTRTIDYGSTGGGPIPDPDLPAMLTNYYTDTFAQALSCPVVASPVV